MKYQARLQIAERSQISEARRLAVTMADSAGFDKNETGQIAIIVTELVTNVIKHAHKGEILIQLFESGSSKWTMDFFSMDKGPGIVDVARAMRDGFSTAGSPGSGLGSVLRLSSLFDIYSSPQNGAVVFARCSAGQRKQQAYQHAAAVMLPMASEDVSGDGWDIVENGPRKLIIVVDGLGHGPLAAEAARLAIKIFQRESSKTILEILESIHVGLRQTRGAAAAIAEINLETKSVSFAGIGNIAGTLVTQSTHRNMVSYSGTLGQEIYKMKQFQYELVEGAVLIMHSDGLGSHWDVQKYPGILARTPALIAGMLFRDFDKGRDDTTVVVYKTSTQATSWKA